VTEIEIAVVSAATIAEIAAAAMALFAIAMAPATGSPEWVRAVPPGRSIAVANPSCARTDSFQSGS
jgi:hypothetical protein